MTQVQYGWIDAEMHQQQVLAIESGMNGTAPKALPAPAGLPPEVMLAALDYAKAAGLPLGEVIAVLTGKAACATAIRPWRNWQHTGLLVPEIAVRICWAIHTLALFPHPSHNLANPDLVND